MNLMNNLSRNGEMNILTTCGKREIAILCLIVESQIEKEAWKVDSLVQGTLMVFECSFLEMMSWCMLFEDESG